MYKIDVEYKDLFTNEKRKETMFFNLTAFEFAQMAADFGGPDKLGKALEKAYSDTRTYNDGFAILKLLFTSAYGRRQHDGDTGRDRFIKNPKWVQQELTPSPEFEAVFLKLSSDAKFSTAFWKGIISEELIAAAEKIYEADGTTDGLPDQEKKVRFDDLPAEEKVKLLQAKLAEKA